MNQANVGNAFVIRGRHADELFVVIVLSMNVEGTIGFACRKSLQPPISSSRQSERLDRQRRDLWQLPDV